nr:MAG TPA: hypothetical protein [Caudoviricetes sp.]DAS04456.1 MAG TPA: hypothetical protein [Caudoviricetes sp.]DAS83184.1 MAG TPA: hypothetical protein [Caudoviricetes sp.]
MIKVITYDFNLSHRSRGGFSVPNTLIINQ